ncbi:MAG: Gfo/Idh/MocA family oxidoreductase [Armatimonadetes bacterium]|nr:Gfo/Idh/MocA family oxidoreductase [Armatimonadota bacterium]
MLTRREVLSGAAAGAAFTTTPAQAQGANNRLVVGVMGTGGRGTGLATAFENQPDVEVAYVCDVDQSRADRAAAAVAKAGGKAPQAVQDFRRVLDDKDVDVLVVATCNHWHAPAAILGCAAGKHVYVEKPCSHNPAEGEWMVQAARKYKRVVQMGNQRRSWMRVREAMEGGLGEIGRVYYAQSWYFSRRGSIGQGKETAPPPGLDYDLWQGPAPRRPFRDNYLHYNWHWFWHWGNGELGNNGIHYIDLCRWGLGVDYPIHVHSTGGRFRFQDDQETPDTHIATFTFPGGKTIMWEGLSCNQMPQAQRPEVVFHGENGSLALGGGGYVLYDPAGKERHRVTGPASDRDHLANFLAAVRGQAPPHSEIEEGHKSTLLCHLGNISYRTGRALQCDPKDGRIRDDREAARMWTREYEPGWKPRV